VHSDFPNTPYIPETNHVSRAHSVAAILWLQFTSHVVLFPMPYTFVVTAVSAQCPIWLFPLVVFSCTCFRHCLSDFEIAKVALLKDIALVLAFYMSCVSIIKSSHLKSSWLLS
jgi:hypothetical protein